MFPNNNDNYPRAPGGYSIETYEPAVIHPEERRKTEDLIRMAFTEKKPVATISRMLPTAIQPNIQPRPIINKIQYANVQNFRPVIYNNPKPNINRIQVVNPNQNRIYRFNNIQNLIPVQTVKPLNTGNKANPFVYQNLIQMNNAYQVRNNNAALPINSGNRFMMANFNIRTGRPVLRSNSAINFTAPNFGNRFIQKRIITGKKYQLHVYKRKLF